jgi:hypothetical protein
MTKTPTASIRVLTDKPDHHLWNNNGTFWCHYTLHFPDYTMHRLWTRSSEMSLEKTGVESSRPVGWPEISRISIPRFSEINWSPQFNGAHARS